MADELLQMFQSITTSDHDELVDQFAYLLELDHGTATFFLESSNWNVEIAVNNYLATMEAQDSAFSRNRADDELLYESGDQQTDDLEMEDGETGGNNNAPPVEHQAQFISDLTASQNAVFPPDAIVNMQWSFVNAGEQPWPEQTFLVFAQGENFGGPQQIQVNAAPHSRIDVHATLRMPSTMGSYAGSWRLRSPTGFFGDPVWVILNVGPTKQDVVQPGVQDPAKFPFQQANHGNFVAQGPAVVGNGLNNNEIEDMDV
uniref:Nbr1 FW domain-containing protein n=1 Tax=Globisporangium ultimum (strain ATCC 200006 / CBS 805.95 / DAOM BR144) TaxID=431595 RepID=K3XBD4_GLOUD